MAEIKMKVLVTGNWGRMKENLMELMEDTHRMASCQLSLVDFGKAVKKLNPDAVVVCMSDEPREVAKAQEAVEASLQSSGIPLFVIGHEEDCQNFKQKVLVPNVEAFTRPLDTAHFLEVLALRASLYRREHTPVAAVKPAAAPVDVAKAVTPAPDMPAPVSQGAYEAELEQMGLVGDEEYYVDEITPERKEAEKKLILHIEKMNLLKGRMSVLVVDDDVRMLNVIKLYLQELYDVVVVPSGKLAIKYLAKKSADLVLLDYMMPELDGPAVLQLIRDQSNCPNIPVLFLTGVSDKNRVLRGLEFRPDGYLLKPVTRMNLLERVTEILLGIQ